MANSYLNKTPSSASNRKTFTFSAWVKRSTLGNSAIFTAGYNQNNVSTLKFDANDKISLFEYDGNTDYAVLTNRVFRDTSAWYHIVMRVDTTQGTANDRVRLYVNGVQETSLTTNTQPSQNYDGLYNSNIAHYIGRYGWNSDEYFTGYMSHVSFVDGQSLAPTSFGQTDSTSGIWKFKSPSGVTWGTNGFHLKMENSAALGTDSSGQSNTFTVNGNLKQALDTPSNVYSTANPLTFSASGYTIINGNLSINGNASNTWRSLYGTLGVSSGKWYWEVKVDAINSSDPNNIMFGVLDADQMVHTANNGNPSGLSRGYQYHGQAGNKINNGSASSYGAVYTAGDIIGIALDLDNHKIYFSKNGTYQASGVPTSGSTGTGSAFNLATGYTYVPTFAQYYSAEKWSANFGNGFFGTTAITSAGSNGNGSLFEYDVPSGYYALNTKNINTYG